MLAACSSSSSSSPGAAASSGTPVAGGTATWAELPATTPNYIFPFTSSAYFSVANISQFQFLMYRPLYWFGDGASPTLNQSLSLADSADVQRPERHHHAEAVQVVQRHPGDRDRTWRSG